jgi:hypothetical protein
MCGGGAQSGAGQQLPKLSAEHAYVAVSFQDGKRAWMNHRVSLVAWRQGSNVGTQPFAQGDNHASAGLSGNETDFIPGEVNIAPA